MELTFEGETYELDEEITGGDYLKLQVILKKANMDIAEESKESLRLHIEATQKAEEGSQGNGQAETPALEMPIADMTEYGLESIVMRLSEWSLDKPITKENILALKSAPYQVLHWQVLKLDGEENRRATDFLVTLLPDFRRAELSSISENSLVSPQAGSEQPIT